MKLVLVTGGRAYVDRDRVEAELLREQPDAVLHGSASGADHLAAQWAQGNDCAEIAMRAKWNLVGKGAGPWRNHQMVSIAAAIQRGGWEVVVLAFPGGRGMEDCILKAQFAGLAVRRVVS